MKCPHCGAWTEVLETRVNPKGKRRRYACANGHRFSTQELLISRTRSARIKPGPLPTIDKLLAMRPRGNHDDDT